MQKEIEKRVALTETEAENVVEKLNKKGAKWTEKERLLMDFSGSLDDRDLQVMVRVNDGVPELSIKRGRVEDVERKEANIHIKSSLKDLLNTIALLGYTEAHYGLRSMKTCVIDDVEFSLRYIRDIKNPEKILGANFELEAAGNSGEEHIDKALEELGLTAMDGEETKKFFQHLREKSDTIYTHSPENADKLTGLVNKWVPIKDSIGANDAR